MPGFAASYHHRPFIVRLFTITLNECRTDAAAFSEEKEQRAESYVMSLYVITPTLKYVFLDLELSAEFNPELNAVEFAIQQICQCGLGFACLPASPYSHPSWRR